MHTRHPTTLPVILLCLCCVLSMGVPDLGAEDDKLKERALEFVNQLVRSDYHSALAFFDSTLKSLVSEEKLQQIWVALQDNAGPFSKTTGIEETPQGNYHILLITCEFENSRLNLKLTFDKKSQIAGLYFLPVYDESYNAPPYVLPGTFISDTVRIGAEPWKLPATVTIPRKTGPHPAVILIHGSGPHDRDETLGPNKPFRDLAEGLSSRGIVVLRYEKRTRQFQRELTEIKDVLTVNEETVYDAQQAVNYVQTRKEIDKDRIFLLGHSLGGMMIPRIGLTDTVCAGFILMAAASRPMEDVILDQISYLAMFDSTVSPEESEQIREIILQIERVKKLETGSQMPPDSLPLGINALFWLDLQNYHPARVAARLKRPILILQAERDYQVTLVDFEGWREHLAYENDVQFIILPGLNHLFMKGEGPSGPREYMKAGHIAPEVIQTIADWIVETND